MGGVGGWVCICCINIPKYQMLIQETIIRAITSSNERDVLQYCNFISIQYVDDPEKHVIDH